MNRLRIIHSIQPIFNIDSKILILGTMPSPMSRKNRFYYSHPQNRFWKVISDVLNQETPNTNEEKENFLITNHIALWDVLKSCEIVGADDSSIKNPEVNDLSLILNSTNISAIFTTGIKATSLYKKYNYPKSGIASTYLPSTSPANCRHFTYDKLLIEYSRIKEYL